MKKSECEFAVYCPFGNDRYCAGIPHKTYHCFEPKASHLFCTDQCHVRGEVISNFGEFRALILRRKVLAYLEKA
jgi:hypothetical protein